MDTIDQGITIEVQYQRGRFHNRKKEGNGPLKPTEQRRKQSTKAHGSVGCLSPGGVGWNYKMPVSSSEFFIIVLATAAKTSRIFDVSVACVMLQWSRETLQPRNAVKDTHCGYTLSFALLACINRHKMYLVALFAFGPPVYSWKYRSSGTLGLIGLLKIEDAVGYSPYAACAGKCRSCSRTR